jgi:hypothetical protein
VAIVVVACGVVVPTAAPIASEEASEEATEAATEADTAPAEAAQEEQATETENAATVEDSTIAVAKNGKPLLDDEPRRPFEPYWNTKFSLHTVPYDEIFSGGVPRDGIPPIDNPKFISITEADDWLEDVEPVFVVTVNNETKAYPIQIMTWHEIVNDTVGDEPVTVTFCPLCNSAITFKRTLNGTVYDFGVSGNLRNSDLIMWDRQTESWWQQLTGEAIVGELVGEQLEFVPTQLVSWANVKTNFPEALVLSRDTGHQRSYGRNPYGGYDSSPQPFLFDGTPDNRLAAMDRVITVDINEEFVAYPYTVLAEAKVIADTVGGEAVVVFWEEGTTSALDGSSIADSRDVGAGTVYSPLVNDETLSFTWDGTNFVDGQTKSKWNIFGQAIAGKLAGTQLEPLNHANHFWFAYAAFRPETRIFQP